MGPKIKLGWLLLAVVVFALSCARLEMGAPPVSRAPEQVDATRALRSAEAHYRSGRYQEALSDISTLLRKYPDSQSAEEGMLLSAHIGFLLGRYKQAHDTYTRFASLYPRSPKAIDARYNALRCLDSLGDSAAVIRDGKRLYPAIRDASMARKTAVMVAENLYRKGRADHAIEWLGLALKGASEGEARSFDEEVLAAVEELAPGTAAGLLQTSSSSPIAPYLLYRKAKDLVAAGEVEKAKEVLGSLRVETFRPELSAAANRLRKSLEWPALRESMAQRPVATIGMLLPLSGPLAEVGERALRAAQLAADPFSNTADLSVTLEIRDSGTDPKGVAAQVEDLASIPGLLAIVGPLSMSLSQSAAQKAQDLKVPIVVLSQKKEIASEGSFVFQNYFTPSDQVNRLVDYAIMELGLKRFALLYPNDPYGREMMNLFWDRVDELGGTVRAVEGYAPRKTDFSEDIKKLVGLYYSRPTSEGRGFPLAEEPAAQQGHAGAGASDDEEPLPIVDFDAIFLPDRPARAQLIIPQLLYHDVEGVRLIGTSLWHNEKLVKEAGRFMEGAIFVDGFYKKADDLAVADFVARFNSAFGYEPRFLEANTFDTVKLLLYLIRDRALLGRRELKNGLDSLGAYLGVTGKISFDENGAARRKLFLFSVHRGRTVEAPEHVAPPTGLLPERVGRIERTQ